MILLFGSEMRVVKRGSAEAATWFAEMDRMLARLPVNLPVKRGLRLSDGRATSARAVIASSFFILLLAATLLIGGHAAIDPFLHPASDANDPRADGDVVVTMPDGKFCRHMSFNNATASMVEGTIEPCRTDISRDFGVPAVAPHGGFAWGTR
jgi:hypothetical protein